MWEYSQTTCEDKQICLRETGGREEALCWMWTKLSSALWRDGSDQQDPLSPSTVAAAELRCQRRWSLSSKKNVFVKTWWSNFCPSLQSADSLRSGNVATLVENRPDRTGAVNSRIIRQFENKSVHFKFSEGNRTSAAQFVVVNIHYG